MPFVRFALGTSQTEKFCRTTLRCYALVVIDWGAIIKAHLTHEWRPRGPWLMVCRGDINRPRTQMSVGFVLTRLINILSNSP